MRGLDGRRVYLDWNATAPLRPEARAAMLEAMDVVGNPSSVHAEGRAAKAILNRARQQVAGLVGCDPDEVVFTSGATEAIAIALSPGAGTPEGVEHEAVMAWLNNSPDIHCMPVANGETGILSERRRANRTMRTFADLTQAVGKIPLPEETDFAALSAHKLGGPKGSGALIVRKGAGLHQFLRGGGQERGRRAGTENVIGIAGFGAAAAAAKRDLEAGVWERVARLRDRLEARLAEAAQELIIFGKDVERLPNTSCVAVPGWAGETQVMQMDLAGFAISAGSACSSGKVKKASRVLLAMGYDEVTASSAIRVSMGWTTTEAEVDAFAETWIEHNRRRAKNAA